MRPNSGWSWPTSTAVPGIPERKCKGLKFETECRICTRALEFGFSNFAYFGGSTRQPLALTHHLPRRMTALGGVLFGLAYLPCSQGLRRQGHLERLRRRVGFALRAGQCVPFFAAPFFLFRRPVLRF